MAPGVKAGLASTPFEPTPSLRPVRVLVSGVTVVAGGLLVLGLGHDWWVVEGAGQPATTQTTQVAIIASAAPNWTRAAMPKPTIVARVACQAAAVSRVRRRSPT